MKRAILSLFVIALLSSCAETTEESGRRYINPGGEESGRPYSSAVISGNTLYLSGQIGIDPQSGELAVGGIEGQTRQVLENIKALVNEAGFEMKDIIKCTVLLDTISDYGAMNRVYIKYFPENPPVRKAFAVEDLPRGALVEIDAQAVR